MRLWSALFQCLLPHGPVADGRSRSFSTQSDAPGSDRHPSLRCSPSSVLRTSSNPQCLAHTSSHASESQPLPNDGYVISSITTSLLPSSPCHTPLAFASRPLPTISTSHHPTHGALQSHEDAQPLRPTPDISAPASAPANDPPSAPDAPLESEAPFRPTTSSEAAAATTGKRPAAAAALTTHPLDSTSTSTSEHQPPARAPSNDAPFAIDKSVRGTLDVPAVAVSAVARITPMPSHDRPIRPNQSFGHISNTPPRVGSHSLGATAAAAVAAPHNAGGTAVPAAARHFGVACAVRTIDAATAAGLSSLSTSRLSSTYTGPLTAPLPMDSPPQVAAVLLSDSSTVSISDTDDEADYGLPSPRSMLRSALAAGGTAAVEEAATGDSRGRTRTTNSATFRLDAARRIAEEAAFIRGTLAALKQATLAGFEDMGGGDILPGLPRVWFAQNPKSTRAPLGSHPIAVASTASAAAVSTGAGMMVAIPNSNASAVNEVRSKTLLNPEVHEANLAALFGGVQEAASTTTTAAAGTVAADATGGCDVDPSQVQQGVQPFKTLHRVAALTVEGGGGKGAIEVGSELVGGAHPIVRSWLPQLGSDSQLHGNVSSALGCSPTATVAAITTHVSCGGFSTASGDADPPAYPLQSHAATAVAGIVMPPPPPLPPRSVGVAPQKQQHPLPAASEPNSLTRTHYTMSERRSGAPAAAASSQDAAAAVTAAGLRYAEMLQQIFARATAAHQLFREQQQQQQQQQQRSAMTNAHANVPRIELLSLAGRQHQKQQPPQHRRPLRQQGSIIRRAPGIAAEGAEWPGIRRAPQQEARQGQLLSASATQFMLAKGVGPSSESLPLPLSSGAGVASEATAAVSGAARQSAAWECSSSVPVSRQSEQGLSPFASALLPLDLDPVGRKGSDTVAPSWSSSCAGGLSIRGATPMNKTLLSPTPAGSKNSQLDSIKSIDKPTANEDPFDSQAEAAERASAWAAERERWLPIFQLHDTCGWRQQEQEDCRFSAVGDGSGSLGPVVLYDDPVIREVMRTGQLSMEPSVWIRGSAGGSVGSLLRAGGDGHGRGGVSAVVSSGGATSSTMTVIAAQDRDAAKHDDILSAPLPAVTTTAEAEVTAFAQQLGDEQRELLAQLVREKWSPFSFPLSKGPTTPQLLISPGSLACSSPLTDAQKAAVQPLSMAPMAGAVASRVDAVPQARVIDLQQAQFPSPQARLAHTFPHADMLQPQSGLASPTAQPTTVHDIDATSQPQHPFPQKPYDGMLHGVPVPLGALGPYGSLRSPPPPPPGARGGRGITSWLGSTASDMPGLSHTGTSGLATSVEPDADAQEALITVIAITTDRSLGNGVEGSETASSWQPQPQPHLPPSRRPDCYYVGRPAPRFHITTTTTSSRALFGVTTALSLSSDPEPPPKPPPQVPQPSLAHLAALTPSPITPSDLLAMDPQKIQSLVKRKWSPFIDIEASLGAIGGPSALGAQLPSGWPGIPSALSNRVQDGIRPD